MHFQDQMFSVGEKKNSSKIEGVWVHKASRTHFGARSTIHSCSVHSQLGSVGTAPNQYSSNITSWSITSLRAHLDAPSDLHSSLSILLLLIPLPLSLYFSQLCMLVHDSSMGLFFFCFVCFSTLRRFLKMNVCLYVWCVHVCFHMCVCVEFQSWCLVTFSCGFPLMWWQLRSLMNPKLPDSSWTI